MLMNKITGRGLPEESPPHSYLQVQKEKIVLRCLSPNKHFVYEDLGINMEGLNK